MTRDYWKLQLFYTAINKRCRQISPDYPAIWTLEKVSRNFYGTADPRVIADLADRQRWQIVRRDEGIPSRIEQFI
jgi:hypothetical protein